MTERPAPPPNYDRTAARRAAKARARAALVLPQIRLDDEHAHALQCAQRPGESVTATVRRLIMTASSQED